MAKQLQIGLLPTISLTPSIPHGLLAPLKGLATASILHVSSVSLSTCHLVQQSHSFFPPKSKETRTYSSNLASLPFRSQLKRHTRQPFRGRTQGTLTSLSLVSVLILVIMVCRVFPNSNVETCLQMAIQRKPNIQKRSSHSCSCTGRHSRKSLSLCLGMRLTTHTHCWIRDL